MRGGLQAAPAAHSEVETGDFDLELTLECGQVFHWKKSGRGYVGIAGSTPLYVEQTGRDRLLVPEGEEELCRRYFALDHPLAEIYGTFPKDEAMAEAARFCHGLRIIRQPLWECLATFITSSLKQVAHIAQISHRLRERFGRSVMYTGQRLWSYPAPERLAEAGEAELRACGLGYRAKNLHATASILARGEADLERIGAMEDEEARAALCELPGVGPKIANCALLFGYGRLRAFPIDVWIERVLREIYFRRKRKVTAKRMEEFSRDYFGEYGGYAQQYLFHHARKTHRERARAK